LIERGKSLEKYVERTINDLNWKSLSALKKLAFERWSNCETIEGRLKEMGTMNKLENAMQEIQEKYKYEESLKKFTEIRMRGLKE
jgi:hypothetical protein